jgi:DNA helicase HerA-like ATPase
MSADENAKLGYIVSGSLNRGVEVRLDSAASVEDVVVGRYVTIQGQKQRFFGMITDISLEVMSPEITFTPPDAGDPFVAEVLSGTGTYGLLHVLSLLTVGGEEILAGPKPVKTVPSHFSAVRLASQDDVASVFGEESDKRFFVGTPLDMETRICLDLENFAKRSNGIFGKSGTGKTFFTRILLAGMVQKSRAVNLIFDMHNEYGWKGTHEQKGAEAKGLKQFFPEAVSVFTLDEEHSRRRGVSTDFVVRIGYEEIMPEDVALLRQSLNLTEAATQAVYQLRQRFGKKWLQSSLDIEKTGGEDGGEILKEMNIHEATYQNLLRGLKRLQRLSFLEPGSGGKSVENILGRLEKGINVVLEFGRHRDILAYMLVANMLTRRIYDTYQERTERAMGDQAAEPQPLVITIEEAHKFLSPEVASQTIFGTIAREMRKYNVTLLLADQRPSGIDEEVMSQLGTKITFLLDNERDIDNVLSGVAGKSELKTVLARLDSRQQALIFGHAVPMPAPIKVRDYDTDFYASVGRADGAVLKEQVEKDIDQLWD